MTTGIIIQARMTSKRFPGKVMAKIGDMTVLERVIERCKAVPTVDVVIVAFPADEASAPIYQTAQAMGCLCCGGSENNVLDRYLDAAEMYGLDTIVRVTADCPFIDPIVIGEVLTLFRAKQLDYASNVFPIRTYPKGMDVEVFSFDALEAANIKATNAEQREHVTPWMQKTKGIRRGNLRQRVDQSGLNLCVDYPEDLVRLQQIVAAVKLPGLGGVTGSVSGITRMQDFNRQLVEHLENGTKH